MHFEFTVVTNNNRIVEIHFEVKIKHASDAQTHDLQGVPQKNFLFKKFTYIGRHIGYCLAYIGNTRNL